MAKALSKMARRQALIANLENMIARECYNDNIQNWGPHGRYEGEGRRFRYPTSYIDGEGKKHKRWGNGGDLPRDEFGTGHYAFGANQLYIVRALERVIDYLQEEHGLEI